MNKLDPMPKSACHCSEWSDEQLIEMSGNFVELLKPLHPFKRHDEKRWWRGYTVCHACAMAWLVAADVRIHDNYLLKRLSTDEVAMIEKGQIWPDYLDTFESLLEAEVNKGKCCRFVDECDDSMFHTVQELLLENHDISQERIAYLLNIQLDNVTHLLKRAKQQT